MRFSLRISIRNRMAFNFLRPISTGNHNSSRDTAIDHWIPVLPRLTDKNEVNTMRRELRRQSGCRVAHLPWSVSSAKHIFHENFIERLERETKRRAATLLVHAHVDRGACTRGRLDRSITRSSEPRDVVWLYQTMLQISRRVSLVFVCARASESAAGGTDASRCTPTMPVASSSLRDGPFYVLRIYNGNFALEKDTRHTGRIIYVLGLRWPGYGRCSMKFSTIKFQRKLVEPTLVRARPFRRFLPNN